MQLEFSLSIVTAAALVLTLLTLPAHQTSIHAQGRRISSTAAPNGGSVSPINDQEAKTAAKKQQGDCVTAYDRFRNATTTTLAPRTIYRNDSPLHEIKMSASAVGEKSGSPKEVDLIFDSTSQSARTRFYGKAEVMFVIDGKRVDGGTAYKAGGFSMRQFEEKLRLTLPASRFLEIIAGRQVEMKIGAVEITFEPEDVKRLRDFATCTGLQNR